MEQLAVAIAKSLFVKQSLTIGSKVINNKRITKTDENGFWISLVVLGVVVMATTSLVSVDQTTRG